MREAEPKPVVMTMNTHAIPTLNQMSPTDFAALGLNQIAFVKPTVVEGEAVFAVHGADGTPLTVVKDRDVAFAVIRQNDMEPVSAH
jgi:hypothetical protein